MTDDTINMAYEVTTGLFGPAAAVPWWAWVALLVMIFWGLLIPESKDN